MTTRRRDGAPLYAPERRRHILAVVARDGRAEVTTLARDLGVSGETIRKDVVALEQEGRVQRVHGGVIPRDVGPMEPRLAERGAQSAEKERIARAAVEELGDARSVFIEAGTTTERVAALLPADRELVVVTNTPAVAVALADRPGLTVLAVGGRIRAATLAAVDDWALRSLAEVHVDLAVLGTNGLAPDTGLTTPDPAEAAVKRMTLGVGRRRLLLADHTKLGRASLCRYGEATDVDLLITDRDAPRSELEALESAGLTVRCV